MTIIGLIVVGVIKSPTLQKGNPYRLLNAIDYNGRICGYDGNVTATPYGYYLPDKTAVCVSSCPSAADYNSFVCKYDLQAEVDNDRTSLKGYHFVSQSQCMYKIKSKIGKKASLDSLHVIQNNCVLFCFVLFCSARYSDETRRNPSPVDLIRCLCALLDCIMCDINWCDVF